MNQRLTDEDLAELVAYLAKRATIMACYLPDIFDGCSVDDLVQDAVLAFLEDRVVFDPTKGASLKTFLATVMGRRLIDHTRRGRKLVSLDAPGALPEKGGDSAFGPATHDHRQLLIDAVENLAIEDPDVRMLVNAVKALDGVPSNLNHVLGATLGRSVKWIENLKRRVRYATKRCPAATRSVLGVPGQEKGRLL